MLSGAAQIAREFGESFVVFVGGLASYTSGDVRGAQTEAREYAKKHGRKNVTIKRIKV